MTSGKATSARGIRSVFHSLIPNQFSGWFEDVHRHLDGIAGDIARAASGLENRLSGLEARLNAVEVPLTGLLPVLGRLDQLQRRLAVDADLATEALLAAARTAERLQQHGADGAEKVLDRVGSAEREAFLPLICAAAARLESPRRTFVVGATEQAVPVALSAMGHDVVTVRPDSSAQPGTPNVMPPVVASEIWSPDRPALMVLLWDIERAAPLLSDEIIPIGGDVSPRVMTWLRAQLPMGTDVLLAVPAGAWDTNVPGAIRDQSMVPALLSDWDLSSVVELHEQDGRWVAGKDGRERSHRGVLVVHARTPEG